MLIEYLPIKPEIIDKEKEIEKLEKAIMSQWTALSISIEILELLKDDEKKVITNRDKLMQTDICDTLRLSPSSTLLCFCRAYSVLPLTSS